MFQKTTAAWATNSLIINLGIGRRPQNNLMCHEILLQANMTCVGVPVAARPCRTHPSTLPVPGYWGQTSRSSRRHGVVYVDIERLSRRYDTDFSARQHAQT